MEKHFKEEELKSFFLTVANYRFSENVEEYVKSIKSISKTPSLYDFASQFPDEFDSYLLVVKGIFSKDKDFDFFFEQQREKFIKTLDQIVSGKPLLKIKELRQIVEEANILQPKKIFEFCNEDKGPFKFYNEDHVLSCKTVLYWDSVISLEAKTENDRTIQIIHKELEMFFSLACYSLCLFLTEYEVERIVRCEQCNNFFVKKRNDPREKFCSKPCRSSFYKMDTETRKDYQARYRENRWLDSLKKRFRGMGYTWEESEKWLKKANQLRKDKYSCKQVEIYLDENM